MGPDGNMSHTLLLISPGDLKLPYIGVSTYHGMEISRDAIAAFPGLTMVSGFDMTRLYQ